MLDSPEPVTGNYFVSTYPPFSCWSEGETEEYRRSLRRPRSGSGETPLGLYVHIPFCVDRCHYCYYKSHDDCLGEMDAYLASLIREATIYADTPALCDRSLSFVYFGGGTPSLMSEPRIRRLIGGLQSLFSWSDVREATFECAPKSVTEGKLRTLRECGVTRISLGIQQMNDEVLRANGRVHLVADVDLAYRAIRAVGFDVVNVDLIVGLVGETDETYRASLEQVIEMAPDSVTTYQLEIPQNTPLWRSIRDGSVSSELASWETKRARLRDGLNRLKSAGYTQTSAYAMVRDPERHRFVYQVEQYHGADLLGIGASAFSHLDGFNQQNRPSLPEYLDLVARGDLPLFRAHESNDLERMLREFVLQLKLGGVDRAYFEDKFGLDVLKQFAEPLAEMAKKGWLKFDDRGVSVTSEGLLRVDRMLPSFYLPEHQRIRYS